MERHDREQFQAEGHWAGRITGPHVYALTLWHPNANMPDGQMLRVIGATESECIGLMTDAIQRELTTLWLAQWQVEFNYLQFQDLNDRMNALAMFIRDNYGFELGRGDFSGMTAETIAVKVLRRERLRLVNRIANWFRQRKAQPELPSDTDLLLPDYMRKQK